METHETLFKYILFSSIDGFLSFHKYVIEKSDDAIVLIIKHNII